MAHFTTLKTWPAAYDDCAARALTGYKGRLAFADSSDLYYLLRGMSTTESYIGLRTIGSSHTASALILAEWAWQEGSTAVQPLTYNISPRMVKELIQLTTYTWNIYPTTRNQDTSMKIFLCPAPGRTSANFCQVFKQFHCYETFLKLIFSELFQLIWHCVPLLQSAGLAS